MPRFLVAGAVRPGEESQIQHVERSRAAPFGGIHTHDGAGSSERRGRTRHPRGQPRSSALAAVGGAARILLACAEDEQHTLALAALAERWIPTRVLGAAVPMSSLVRAVRETGPETVVLWSQQPRTARQDELRALRALSVGLVTAGPGWPARSKRGMHHVATLPEAVAVLAR